MRLVEKSATAFEMYHALLAIQEIAPALTSDQRQRAMTVLEREQGDPRSIGVRNDPGLPYLLERTLGILRGRE